MSPRLGQGLLLVGSGNTAGLERGNANPVHLAQVHLDAKEAGAAVEDLAALVALDLLGLEAGHLGGGHAVQVELHLGSGGHVSAEGLVEVDLRNFSLCFVWINGKTNCGKEKQSILFFYTIVSC